MRQNLQIWVKRSTPLLAAATLALIPLTACSSSSSGGGDKEAPVVTANPATQVFAAAFDVTLTAVDNKDPAPLIYYTTDLSIPDVTSTLYVAPINIPATTILKFIGVDASGNISDVGIEGYTFAADPLTMQWAASGHGDIIAEAFRHWDEDVPPEVPTSCAKCHAGEGFLDYLEDGVVDLPAALPLGHFCDSCHAVPPATLYDDLVTYPFLEPVEFPSGDMASLWGPSNMCIVCHSGRESKVTVDDKITTTPGGPHTFTNIHYYAAAATLFGSETQGGYEYDTMDYAGRNTFGSHEVTEQTCVGCHMPGGPADHTFVPDIAVCNTCHAGATFETLDGSPTANYDALQTGDTELYAAIQAHATTVIGENITYDPDSYPYWFKDDGTRYDVFDDELLKAAYNYQVLKKDPAGFVHNGTYLRQLAHDSIVDLGGTPTDIAPGRTGFTPSAGEAGKSEEWHLSGHADSAGEAFRHWDDDGEVSASCAQCHSTYGFIEYAQTGAVAAAVPLGSLVDCQACHVDTDLFTNVDTRYDDIGNHASLDPVLFPSGVTQTLGDNSNMCMTCHQGRESGASVVAPTANAVVQAPTDYTSYNFINRHYFAAAAILFGTDVTAAWEYAGQTYKGQNTYSGAHGSLDSCFECHMRGAAADHTWLPQVADCSGCHAGITNFEELGLPFGAVNVDYDGDGVGESFQLEIDGMGEVLYATIQAYANGSLGGALVNHTSLIVYGPGSYPYWFVDADGDGLFDPTIDVDRYEDFDLDLLRGAFNYHSDQDPCNDMHNFQYALQTTYDAIDWLDDGALNGSPAGTAAAMIRP